ncbi:MAG TPA: hypothetical protein VIY73_29295, partial [Polyangiaceae bacterium]
MRVKVLDYRDRSGARGGGREAIARSRCAKDGAALDGGDPFAPVAQDLGGDRLHPRTELRSCHGRGDVFEGERHRPGGGEAVTRFVAQPAERELVERRGQV